MIWISHRAAGQEQTFWDQLPVDSDPFLDPGPMWFVEVLLLYSLAYAAWRHSVSRWPGLSVTPLHSASARGGSLSGRTLVVLAVAISVTTVLVRPVFPITSAQIGQLKLFQWPQFAAMFGLGVVAAQRGWVAPVSGHIRRGCGIAALAGIVAFFVLFGMTAAIEGDDEVVFETGLHWAPLVLAAIEGPLAVGASVWLLAVAQRCLDRQPGPIGRAMSRSACAAFLLQGVVLIALMVAMRLIGPPAEVKALTVAGLALVHVRVAARQPHVARPGLVEAQPARGPPRRRNEDAEPRTS